jgi:hypothetical protein
LLAGKRTSSPHHLRQPPNYVYDIEGRICAVEYTAMVGMTTMTGYLYDADGNRIAKGTITAMNCDPATNGFQLTASYVLGQSGDSTAFAAAMGGAGHLIQDSFAHTTRDGGSGDITHIQCYTCTGAEMDHQHPDFQPVATGGVLSPQAQGSVDATADFLTLINGSANMSTAQFQQGLQQYENKWFQQKLPQQ